jgi:hypothetical protein
VARKGNNLKRKAGGKGKTQIQNREKRFEKETRQLIHLPSLFYLRPRESAPSSLPCSTGALLEPSAPLISAQVINLFFLKPNHFPSRRDSQLLRLDPAAVQFRLARGRKSCVPNSPRLVSCCRCRCRHRGGE